MQVVLFTHDATRKEETAFPDAAAGAEPDAGSG